jgi:preprotein translocase subunit SecA
MRIFGSDRISGLMQRLGMEEGVPIEHGMVTRAIERAQKQVEGRNFESRKHLLEYDDVMNKQRESVYTLRRSILEGREGKEYILNAADEIVDYLVDTHYPEGDRNVPDEAELNAELYDYFGLDLRTAGVDLQGDRREDVKYKLTQAVNRRYEEKENLIGVDNMRLNEKYLLLQVIDQQWKDHLLNIDHLKEGISLRGYGQRDPLIEYKRESFDLFQSMMERIQDRVVKILWKIELAGGPSSSREGDGEEAHRVSRALPPQPPRQQMTFSGAPKEAPAPVKRAAGKVGRNDPCPCGSGKKYKKCHGTDAA